MITVTVSGKALPVDAIKEWESKRLAWSSCFLTRKLGSAQKIDSNKALLECKLETPEAEMRHALGRTLAISSFFTKMLAILSHGKRKLCVTEFLLQGCSAQRISVGFNAMMRSNTAENRMSCLAACPDHYLLKGHGDTVQEVIEVAASMPLPLQFFVTYGDESGLTVPKDGSYPFQAAGVARLKSGLAMGGVRHQMKDTQDGCAVRLTVEFPALLPDRNIRAHQLHLACEFYHWFSELMAQNRNAGFKQV